MSYSTHSMALTSRSAITTTFEPQHIIQPIYTGGDVSLDSRGHVLASCIGEDALVTDLDSGKVLARVEGDGEVLTALLITPSASHLVLCSRSISMRIYALEPADSDDGLLQPTIQRSLKPHSTPVVTATIDRTSTLLATGGADGTVKVWDIRGGYVSHTFRGHSGVISALHFFEASLEQQGRRSSMKQGRKSQQRDGNGDTRMTDREERSSGQETSFLLASGGEDGKVRIWDLQQRKAVANLDSHVSVVRALDYSREQNSLLSGSRDKTLMLWDVRTWKSKKVVPVLENVEAAGFLHDGRYVYAAGENGVLRVWNFESGLEVTRERKSTGEENSIIQVSRCSSRAFLMSVHNDQSLIMHGTKILEDVAGQIDALPILRRISGTHDDVIDLAYVTPENRLMALATNSESIRLVSVGTQASDRPLGEGGQYFGADVGLLEGHEDIILCLDVDWSGCWLATGAKDNVAKLWRIDHDGKRYECVATLTGHAESIGAVSLPKAEPPSDSAAYKDPSSHPPHVLVTGSQDKTIKRWHILPKQFSNIEKLSPRASFTRKAHDKDINAIDTNHNTTLFASASQDRTVKIWSIEAGEVQGILRGHRRGVWSVKFAPKDTPSIAGEAGQASGSRGFVLTGSGDKTVRIWSLADYSCLRTLEGHTNSVLKVLWLPCDRVSPETNSRRQQQSLFASAGGDGLVKVWDAHSGECTSTLDNHTDRVWSLAIPRQTASSTSSPAGPASLVSGSADSTITFWRNTTTEAVAAQAAASNARVEQDQMLQSHVHAKNYREAIVLALQLNHPAQLLSLLVRVGKTTPPDSGSLTGLMAVDEVLASLDDEHLFTLLLRVRDWNTNARTAPVAQRVLGLVVRRYSAERLTGLAKVGRGKGRALAEVLDGLKAYTERHYRRMEELVNESFVVDWVVERMGVIGDTRG